MRGNIVGVLFLVSGTGPAIASASAQVPGPTTVDQRQEAAEQETAEGVEKRTVLAIAEKASIEGPATIELLDQAELALPAGLVYLPAVPAARLLRAYAKDIKDRNNRHPNLVGLVAPTDTSPDSGLVLIHYVRAGGIDDGIAATWDTDELLARIRSKAAARNRRRDARQLEILGWVEVPAYDAARHHLVSSLLIRQIDQAENPQPGVDYDTYALGRDGYFHLKLLTSPKLLASQRPVVDRLLEALRYRLGKRYEDFNSTTDRPASHGLSALVGSGLLREPSFWALFFAYLERFGRPAIGLIVFGFWAVTWFRRRRRSEIGHSAP